jgi:hypothetical protein
LAAEVRKLRATGVDAYTRDEWDALGHATAVPLRDLCNGEGQPFPDDYDHSGCEGHVIVAHDRPWDDGMDLRVLCRDPEAYGHLLRPWARAQAIPASDPDDPAIREAQRKERRRVIRCNREWRAARTVRQHHLQEVLRRRTAPKVSLALITTLTAEGAHNDAPTVLAELLAVETTEAGWKPQGQLITNWLGDSPNDARRTLAMVAMLAADVEQKDLHDNRWRNPARGGRAETYLDWLVDHTGYALSPVESLAIGRMTQDDIDSLHTQADEATS